MTELSLAEQIAARLRRDILRGKLPPDTAIKERDNAAELGVSRTPMREAIRILSQEGLVLLRPARSPIVARHTVKEVHDQVVVLLTLEKLSAHLACVAASDSELDGLTQLNGRIGEAYDHVDALDLFEMDMAFHRMIAEISHNEALAETHRAYLARLWRARFLSAKMRRNRERVVTHHSAITTALRSRDPEAVDVALDMHLGNLAEDISAAIAAENEATR
ncbi:GntR family transcriptional regulator [Salipiger marinus]|jgi:GntR family transcriptional regulator, rspAB operon transcriptional repressor|uniref:Transcriptional regulator, GntR family n=1 Tax=Salipiger marinus TaxID=555512 RepID=A0A1G8INN3_9RHOB|nr:MULTISPECIES: GntR family transcriptional regulator [Salipiger]HBM59381.1 GntR family transcriptional regulator [Citreicella sp.]MCD1620869.1 GntR family transcriptional regulator [Salipiger manganoxidans]MEB3422028.1 GntR family transcriptional regulator [Salipiger manganoxidans]SDI20120.1 transcriptional regulator, GntR family [Salipiger marinus]HBT03125.1 GntR family transcriptional regulator [Citreicella sp.]|tara:strand:+ start:356 stop:1015 length:660 start_codon:yes stop_codon:yes gene_type:complete